MLRIHWADAPLAAGAELDLPPPAVRHVQVRRLQPGDALVLFDGRGGEWHAVVRAMTRAGVRVELLRFDDVGRELATPVTLAVGMPANERMDWLVEKGTELGAAAIQPLVCERSVLRLDADRAARRRAHWQALADGAAEQSGRTRVTRIAPIVKLADWLAGLPPEPAASTRWLLSVPQTAEAAAPQAVQPERCAPGGVTLLSGPEGGFSVDEERAALQRGFERATLGARVLRAETAPLAVLAVLAWHGDRAAGADGRCAR